MLLVTCRQGGEHVFIRPEDDERDPHRRLDAAGCTHCAEDSNTDPAHHCGAAECASEHEGTCFGHDPDPLNRPDGCTVCRPLFIELLPGSAPVTGA